MTSTWDAAAKLVALPAPGNLTRMIGTSVFAWTGDVLDAVER